MDGKGKVVSEEKFLSTKKEEIRFLAQERDGSIGNKLIKKLMHDELLFFTFDKGKRSQDSFSIGDDEEILRMKFNWLVSAFDLAKEGEGIDQEMLYEYFRDAVSGEGMEIWRINRLGSSSLLAFLCFATVMAREGAITIDVPNEGFVEFKELKLEYENKLFAGRSRPSSVDIFLSNDKYVLFLESKFSEYLETTDEIKKNLSIRYAPYYSDIFGPKGKREGQEIWWEDGPRLRSETKNYLEGIKQMISHWIGVKHEVEFNEEKRREWCDKKLLLGGILFNFKEGTMKENVELKAYADQYQWLAKRLNSLENKVRVLPELLTYQSAFKGIRLPRCVHEYYRLGSAMGSAMGSDPMDGKC